MTFRVLYFASLRDQAGRDGEEIEAGETDARALYAALQKKHGFRLGEASLRVAINGAFASWDRALRDGDEIAFLPPVSGG
ncbi:MAG TPA: molybdopterin converting factor subunit 1 [Rudaea sp.]